MVFLLSWTEYSKCLLMSSCISPGFLKTPHMAGVLLEEFSTFILDESLHTARNDSVCSWSLFHSQIKACVLSFS